MFPNCPVSNFFLGKPLGHGRSDAMRSAGMLNNAPETAAVRGNPFGLYELQVMGLKKRDQGFTV